MKTNKSVEDIRKHFNYLATVNGNVGSLAPTYIAMLVVVSTLELGSQLGSPPIEDTAFLRKELE